MNSKRIGKRTVKMESPVSIVSNACIVGPTEGEGPLGKYFDRILDDDLWGEETWEKAESKILYETVRLSVKKGKTKLDEIDYVLGGDLLNQLIATSYAAREMDFPYIGLYGACSTMAEALSVGAMLVDGGFARHAICCASSHFSTAERQFRFPLEMGTQKPPTAQRTVTGAGASMLAQGGEGPFVTYATIGTVVDFGIKDANNMGAAMAPAAADTIFHHLCDTGTDPDYYDAIFTGDLGIFGKELLGDLLEQKGIQARHVLRDCGAEMFDKTQDAHMGGSGCGCCGSVFNGMIVPALRQGSMQRVLVVATGALMSTVSTMQGESIPGIAHAVRIERERREHA